MLRKLGRLRPVLTRQPSTVPPGQFVTEKFPVLTFGAAPRIDLATWRFHVFGLVDAPLEYTWDQLVTLGHVVVRAPFHCVTQWSRMDNVWEGVPFSAVAAAARPAAEASYVMVHCHGGHTTNVALDVLLEDDVLLAHRHDGEELSRDHGGPLRLVVPSRYGYKSAKWVSGIEFMSEDAPGFWEAKGYHMEGDPTKEQRFWNEIG